MANFFNYYPLTFYTVDANTTSLDTVTNIISRFAFENSLKENSAAFYKYNIKDTDTPESIASKYYNNPERHWIVLLFNDIIDPQYDWPLNYNNFVEYVDKKYAANGSSNTTVQSGLAWAQSINNIHSYYQVNTRTVSTSTVDNKTITEKIQVTANVYANVIQSTRTFTLENGAVVTEKVTKEKLTYYDYEMQVNESKRTIKLLKPEFAGSVVEEFKQIINP